MKITRITRTLAAMALAIATVPAALAEQASKPVHRTIVVKDGRVLTAEGEGIPRHMRVPRAFLGVQTFGLTPELREHFRVSKDAGVLVGKVVPDSPAAKANIRVGDVITAVDGKPVESPGALSRAVRNRKKGDALRIDYSRDGANATAVATVVEREMKVVDLGDLDIQIPDIQIPDIQIPDVGRNLEVYFNGPEWKAKMERLQRLPDCGEMQERMRQLESKMKDLEKRLQK